MRGMKRAIAMPTDFKRFIETYRDRVYRKIIEYIPTRYPKDYAKMVRVYVDRKGQYRRPSYLILWSLLYGSNVEDAILPAAVQQASEDWILMLDDVMDSNELRRGGPTAHTLYGSNFALSSSSQLHAINWKMATEAAKQLGSERGERYFNKFFDMIDVTQVGQYHDLTLTNQKDITKFTLEEYYNSIHGKAAYYTIYGPMQAGAIIAGAGNDVVERIPEYGVPAGVAFQIKDDILDCVSTTEVLGKTVGNDIMDGTKTLILRHAVQNSSPSVLAKLRSIYMKDRKQKTKGDVKFVLDTFKGLGSLDYAQKEAEKLSDIALRNFEKLTVDVSESDLKKLARDAIKYTTARTE